MVLKRGRNPLTISKKSTSMTAELTSSYRTRSGRLPSRAFRVASSRFPPAVGNCSWRRSLGAVAGTSARLQPAQIRLHWDKVSLADLFRLITGNDSGVRGQFALDGSASVGTETSSSDVAASMWRIALQARATQIHRWDLTERDDNPRINVNVKGSWDLA